MDTLPQSAFQKVFPLLGISECLPCRKCKENNIIMNMSQYPTTQTHLRGWWYITSHHESSMTPVKWKKKDFEQMTFASQLVQIITTFSNKSLKHVTTPSDVRHLRPSPLSLLREKSTPLADLFSNNAASPCRLRPRRQWIMATFS